MVVGFAKKYFGWTKPTFHRKITSVVAALPLDEHQKRIIFKRYVDTVVYYERHARKLKHRFRFLEAVILVGGVLLPSLLSLQNITSSAEKSSAEKLREVVIYWATFGLSIIITICNGFMKSWKLPDRYHQTALTMERMKRIGWEYFELAGKFRDHSYDSGYRLFWEEFEKIKKEQVIFDYVDPHDDEEDSKKKKKKIFVSPSDVSGDSQPESALSPPEQLDIDVELGNGRRRKNIFRKRSKVVPKITRYGIDANLEESVEDLNGYRTPTPNPLRRYETEGYIEISNPTSLVQNQSKSVVEGLGSEIKKQVGGVKVMISDAKDSIANPETTLDLSGRAKQLVSTDKNPPKRRNSNERESEPIAIEEKYNSSIDSSSGDEEDQRQVI